MVAEALVEGADECLAGATEGVGEFDGALAGFAGRC